MYSEEHGAAANRCRIASNLLTHIQKFDTTLDCCSKSIEERARLIAAEGGVMI